MRKTLRLKYVAAEVHALLFIFMWVLSFVFSQPLMDGPAGFLFLILFIADLPISFIAFAVMFTSSEMGSTAAVLWGILGTLWWFAIGIAIEARIRSHRENRARTGLFPATAAAESVSAPSRRREFVIAASIVAVLVVASIAWHWRGWQGRFESGEIRSLVFAPDGRSIVLVRSQKDSSRLERVLLKSGATTRIGNPLSCMAYSPTYSPDGAQIALACENKTTGLSQILILSTDGGNLHPLFSSNSDNYDFAPHFSSDGKEVYFGRFENTGSGGAHLRRWDIYSASLDGKNDSMIQAKRERSIRLRRLSCGVATKQVPPET